MPTIALVDEARKLAGFLLLAGDAPLGPAPLRNCLFMAPPLQFSSLRRIDDRLVVAGQRSTELMGLTRMPAEILGLHFSLLCHFQRIVDFDS